MAWCIAPGVRRVLFGMPRRSTPTGTVRSRVFAAGLLALSLGACDFPTEPPIFESRFVVPGENTSLSVNQLLPSSVSVAGNAFTLSLAPQSFSQKLEQMCPACVALNGQTAPVPGFTSTVPVTVTLPADVASAALTSGSVNVTVSQNFGFDPINPPGSATKGKVVITITNNNRVIGYDSLGTSLPSGTPVTRTIALQGGTITGPISVSVQLTTPAGGLDPADWRTINTNSTLNVTATPANISISSATVNVASRNVSVTSVNLDLSDIDDALRDRASGGAIVLKMVNPWPVSGALQLRIQGGNGVNITKTVTVAAGTTTQRITFTESEIQQMLGQNLTLTISGPVSASGAVTVTPNQVITVETTLDLVLRLGA